ncbi:MAG: tetratricopeptide repeat protein, partial [candidate division WOR-3 bacterium]
MSCFLPGARLVCTSYALFALLNLLGCAYYNTFYNAKAAYQEGLRLKASGNNARARESFDKAIKKCAKVIKQHPRSPWVGEALFTIGVCYFEMGEFSNAVSKLDDFEAAFPGSGYRDQARLYCARSLLGTQDYIRATRMFRTLRDSSPRVREDAEYFLAMSLLERSDLTSAIAALEEFQRNYPKSRYRLDVSRTTAETYFKLGHYHDAARAYAEHRKQVRQAKEQLIDDIKIAECYLMSGIPESTLALMSRQENRYPEFADQVALLTGKALIAKGNKEGALQALANVRTGAAGAEASLLLARSFEQDAAFELALTHYDSARLRAPSSDFAREAEHRAQLIRRLYLNRQESADTAQDRFLLAEVYRLNLGLDSIALEKYQQVADSFPTSPYAPKALYAVAWLKARSLRTADSLAAFRRVIDRYPKTMYAQEARKSLGLPLLPDSLLERPTAQKPGVRGKIPLPDTAVGASDSSSLAASHRLDTLASLPGAIPPPSAPRQAASSERMKDRRERGRGTRSPLPGRNEAQDRRLAERQAGRPEPGAVPSPIPDIQEPEPPPESSLPLPEHRAQGHPPLPPSQSGPQAKNDNAERESQVAPELDTTTRPLTRGADTNKLAGQVQISEGTSALNLTPGTTAQEKSPTEKEDVIPPIFFDHDSDQIRPGDTSQLNALLSSLRQASDARLVITGFCDPTGSRSYNLRLGLRRAQSVKAWLVARGISAT